MRCPRDQGPLDAITYEADIEVDRCAACHGVWLDAGELRRIQETIERDHAEALRSPPEPVIRAFAMSQEQNEPPLECPQCETDMARREHGLCSQVFVDVCPSCDGTWLDHGELESLEAFFEQAREDARELRLSFWGNLLRRLR